MAIKGTATIELTNADGSKEIIKHDNMITNAVNDLCMSQRGEMASILKIVNNGDSYAQALFGGLLLFDETLNDNPDDYFFPTTKVTGYASQDAYAGLDISRGSFNASEGGVQEDGSYKFVWDFSTSQANGTIKSLALCPNMMGRIGATNDRQVDDARDFYITNDLTAPFNSYGRMLPDNGTTEGISNYNFNIVAVVGDIAYAVEEYNIRLNSNYASRYITNNGGILRFYKFKLGATSISLADKVCRARYLGYDDVTLPSEFISILHTGDDEYCLSYFYDYETSTLTVFPCYKKADIPINGTTKYVDINLTNMSTTLYTFTNNTAGIIPRNGTAHNGGQRYSLFVCRDYIVNCSLVGEYYNMYITKRSDNTQVVKCYGKDKDGLNAKKIILFRPLFISNNMMVLRIENPWYVGEIDNPYMFAILDMNTGLLKTTNAKNMSIDNMVDIGHKTVFARCMSYASYWLTINPFILTTKNNLDAPVVKTASQTMKITYTLSEVAEV